MGQKLSDLKKLAEKEKSESIYFKPKAGKNLVRLVPTKTSTGPVKKFYQHYYKDKYYVTDNPKNPLAQYGWDKYNSLNAIDHDEAVKAMKPYLPQTKFAINVFDGSETKIWSMSESQFKDILTAIEADGNDDVLFDQDHGKGLIINRNGEGKGTKYTFHISPNEWPIGDDIYESAIDLDDWFSEKKVYDDELKALI